MTCGLKIPALASTNLLHKADKLLIKMDINISKRLEILKTDIIYMGTRNPESSRYSYVFALVLPPPEFWHGHVMWILIYFVILSSSTL